MMLLRLSSISTPKKAGVFLLFLSALAHAESVPQVPGAERLLDVLTIRPEYNQIVTAMLGSVYIADDLASALKLRSTHTQGATFVTLQGEIIDNQCVITGGML